ncbi:hypothetical protein, partial [Bradyrhizobium lablabi]
MNGLSFVLNKYSQRR